MTSLHQSEYKRLLAELVTARKEAGMTQMELAKRLKKPQSFISKYEQGERRLDVVEFMAIAKILGKSHAEILRQLKS